MLDFLRRRLGRISISLISQVIASGANFAVGLYMVRTLTPEQFGLYGVGMAIALLYVGLGNALFLTQMTVRLPAEREEDRPALCTNILVLVILFVLLSSLLGGAGVTIANYFLGWESGALILGYAIIGTSMMMLIANFFLRLAFSRGREVDALLVNMTVAMGLGIGLLGGEKFDSINSAASVLAIYVGANMAGSIVGYMTSWVSPSLFEGGRMYSFFRKSIGGGGWASAGVAVTWLQGQAYMYVSAILLGPAAVGVLNAGRMLIAPFSFALPAFTQMLLPRLAQEATASPKSAERLGRVYSAVMVAGALLYVGALAYCGRDLIPLLLGDSYDADEVYLIGLAWGAVLIFQLCTTSASLIMRALHEFRAITLSVSLSAALTILLVMLVAGGMGNYGVILATGVGEALLATLLWSSVRRRVLHA